MRKFLAITVFSLTAFLAFAGVFAFPWSGMSYLERWREQRSGRIYHNGRTSARIVALTFDDGPDPRYTANVLDTLKRHKIRATFFVCGDMLKENPELGRRIIEEGHAIGNHTETHPHLERLAGKKARLELSDCERQIEQITGERTFLFRPPRGLWSPVVFDEARRQGYSIILWSLAFDRQAVKDSHILGRRVVRLARPGDIILMHDGSTDKHSDIRRPTLRELDSIVRGLESRGFRFATVPELLHIRGNRLLASPAKPHSLMF